MSLTDKEIEAGWHKTFSTSNPYCPCDLKSFTKAVRWAESHVEAMKRIAGDTIPPITAGFIRVYDEVNGPIPAAMSASAKQAEPIYQLQRADGSWIDQAEHSYKYNLSHGHAVRIVYAAPAPSDSGPLINKGTKPVTAEDVRANRRNGESMWDTKARLEGAPSASPICTCPSGDGSLRHPCPSHPSASPSALTDEQINEAFDSFCRNMSLVSVLYREDAQKFARTLLARSRARITADTGDSEADSLIDRLMSLSPTFTECERAAGYIRRAALAASPDALTDERVFELVGEVLGQPLIVEDLRQGFAVHTEPRDWLNFARALLAASPADQVEDARDAALEEAARIVEDFNADKGVVTFSEIALAIRAAMSASKEGA